MDIRGDTRVGIVLFIYLILLLFAIQERTLPDAAGWAARLWSAIIFSIFLARVVYRLSPLHPLYNFPGPVLFRCTNLAIAYIVFKGYRHVYVARLHAQYGDFVRIGPNKISVLRNDVVHAIYSSAKCMDKSLAYRLGHFFDGGLFFIREREKHSERRRAWAGAFSAASFGVFSSSVLKSRSEQLVKALLSEEPRTLDLGDMLSRWSYDVMGDLTFGSGKGFELMEEGDKEKIIENGQRAMIAFDILGEIPSFLDVLYYLPATKSIHQLETLAAKKLKIREQSHSNDPDIVSHLLKSNEGDSNSELLAVDTLFAIQAGSDTITGVSTLLFYYVLSNRDVYDKLTKELDEYYARESSVNIETLIRLPYLGAVIQEGLRLGTPFPGLPRVAPSTGIILGDRYVPGGTVVSVPAYAQQTSARNFGPDPFVFRPERWYSESSRHEYTHDASAIMCFSSGPFGCLGKSLAIKELHVLVAYLLLFCHLEPPPSFDRDAFLHGVQNMQTTVFSTPLMAHVKRRRDK